MSTGFRSTLFFCFFRCLFFYSLLSALVPWFCLLSFSLKHLLLRHTFRFNAAVGIFCVVRYDCCGEVKKIVIRPNAHRNGSRNEVTICVEWKPVLFSCCYRQISNHPKWCKCFATNALISSLTVWPWIKIPPLTFESSSVYTEFTQNQVRSTISLN